MPDLVVPDGTVFDKTVFDRTGARSLRLGVAGPVGTGKNSLIATRAAPCRLSSSSA